MNADQVMSTLAITLLAAGAALFTWALFWDRARGRRRCPKCWYDMSGAPGQKCPECGREAKSERSLQRTRRRWKWAGAGCGLCIAAYAAWVTPEVRQRGWIAAVPTWGLIAAAPMPEFAEVVGDEMWRLRQRLVWREILHRRGANILSLRQERAIMNRLARAYGGEGLREVIRTRSHWVAGEPV